MTRVKICGLTKEEDVAAAVEAGADAVGFICGFPESPRNISEDRVRELVHGVPPFVESVLVTRLEFVVAHPGIVRRLGPSALQLYGPRDEVRRLGGKLRAKLILPYLVDGNGERLDPRGFDAVLSDTYRKGQFGGTGETSNWGVCRRLREGIDPVPFILSGGLNPRNVREAVQRVRPFAVDASSGVEASPGIKDHAMVRAFVRSAKEE